jgi:mannose-6-phosphate isomerase
MTKPRRLESKSLVKVWGSPNTEPWHFNPEKRAIGEVWFTASDAAPLLIKFLFTSDKLSIQVHPEDEYAREHHDSLGKTEMWHILRAEPDAKVALGFKETISPERFREACLSGEVEELVNWVPARAGDTFFTPARTVHAIGGGLTICEIQQDSDITYRLFDYWRPDRELHLEHGVKVSRLEPYAGLQTRQRISDSRELLAECQYFRTERLEVQGSVAMSGTGRNTVYIAIEGSGTFAGAHFAQGTAWEVPADAEPFEIVSPGAVFLVTFAP